MHLFLGSPGPDRPACNAMPYQLLLMFVCLILQDGDILLTPNSMGDRTQTLLMIPNLGIEDAGIYWCKSRNVWGEVNATFPVKIYGE